MTVKSIDKSVIDSVVSTLEGNQLFRYDCDRPEESAAARLEKRFAEVLGAKYCVAMNSCSSALFVSLLTCGVEPGDKVLIPAFTFIAVPSAVVHAGAVPILVEVDENYVIDLDAFEDAIAADTKYLLLSYMRGRVPNLDKVLEICERHGICMIEDSAHSLGVTYKGRATGTFGRTGNFSAQSYKLIDGGEGGLLVTDDQDVAFKSMLYAGCYERNWDKHFGIEGEDAKRVDGMVNSLPAYNFRMSNLSAAALIPQLEQLEARTERYNRNYYHLEKILAQSAYIRLPEFIDGVKPVCDSIQFYIKDIPLELIQEAQIRLEEQHGISMSVFGLSGKNARCFWHWTFIDKQNCPKTRALLDRTADMRLRLHLEPADIEHIGNSIVSVFDQIGHAAADVV